MNGSNSIAVQQRRLCAKYSAAFHPPLPSSKLGIASIVRSGVLPVHGLRHSPEGDINGWYIWAGAEFSDSPEFFSALHVEHIADWCPLAPRFLALPPGWRFLVTPEHEDVWFDQTLLDA